VRATSAGAAINDVDVIVIATAWEEFRTLPAMALVRSGRRAAVLDCWRMLDPAIYGEIVDLHHLGKGPSPVVHGEQAQAIRA
jgi:hypothetical protein